MRSFLDDELMVRGFKIFRRERNKYVSGVAFYVQDHIPVKVRNYLMLCNIEALWVQVHLPHLKPILVGCYYKPPSANIQYLNEICDMFDVVCDEKREIFILGDLNIDWFSPQCPMRKKLHTVANACGLKQIMTLPTRVSTNASVTS